MGLTPILKRALVDKGLTNKAREPLQVLDLA